MNKSIPPLPEKIQNTVAKLQVVNRQFDALNFTLDQLITQIDQEIQNNPLKIHRLKKSREIQNA